MTGVEEGAVFDAFDWGLGGGFFGGDYLMEEFDWCEYACDGHKNN